MKKLVHLKLSWTKLKQKKVYFDLSNGWYISSSWSGELVLKQVLDGNGVKGEGDIELLNLVPSGAEILVAVENWKATISALRRRLL